ncbi:kinase-like domain-containing protein [Gigaspora rosea]|uniref:Kinase-like domain-containing protein n=1 Tax=Gigaspora rosea TaxID=44941 RepID=A0A397U7P6_9GLOM|nr:kinase-like domain-containing protein [Gigaspora rosea]
MANFAKLEWTDKLRIAKEIALGLLFLHNNNIIHRHLHSKNILIHQGQPKITDFGVSKNINEINSNSNVHGMPAYIEPQCFFSHKYRRNMKSDVYSLGIIFWEISSGRPPFSSFKPAPSLMVHIYQGNREVPIEGTPFQYVELYKKCWDVDPANRPETRVIFNVLRQIITSETLSQNNPSSENIENFDDFSISTSSPLYLYDHFEQSNETSATNRQSNDNEISASQQNHEASSPNHANLINLSSLTTNIDVQNTQSTKGHNSKISFQSIADERTSSNRYNEITSLSQQNNETSSSNHANFPSTKTSLSINLSSLAMNSGIQNTQSTKGHDSKVSSQLISDEGSSSNRDEISFSNQQDNDIQINTNIANDWYTTAVNDYKLEEINFYDIGIAEQVGNGAYGAVYRATYNSTEVAVKEVFITSDDSENIKVFINELKLHSRTIHSRIIQFYGISCDRDNETYYLVMEYAKGGTLRQYVKKPIFTCLDKMKLASQIVEGMVYLHSINIIHRDLHSKNILIHYGDVKIADFGLSKSLNSIASINNNIRGMIPYIDPQKLRNDEYILDKKSDVYSVGVLLWEISSCCIPFKGREEFAIFHQIANEGLREKPTKTMPDEYIKLYSECWREDPSDRPSMSQVFEMLKSIDLYPTLVNDFGLKEICYTDLGKKKKIGRGAFGIVYSTTCSSLNKMVAVKDVEISSDDDHETIKSFIHELKLHSQATHSRIIQFYGISRDQNSKLNCLVMEYAEGGTLQKYIQNKDLIWQERIRLAKQITEGIAYLHSIKIIHRDLHSKNVLIHYGDIKIADFGLSKNLNSTMTTKNSFFGIIPYIDPQKLYDEKYVLNEKSDIYSIGVLFWEISSRRIPFKNEGQSTLGFRIIQNLREKPIKGTPCQYIKLYSDCWEKDPLKRPPPLKILERLESIEHEPVYNGSDQ